MICLLAVAGSSGAQESELSAGVRSKLLARAASLVGLDRQWRLTPDLDVPAPAGRVEAMIVHGHAAREAAVLMPALRIGFEFDPTDASLCSAAFMDFPDPRNVDLPAEYLDLKREQRGSLRSPKTDRFRPFVLRGPSLEELQGARVVRAELVLAGGDGDRDTRCAGRAQAALTAVRDWFTNMDQACPSASLRIAAFDGGDPMVFAVFESGGKECPGGIVQFAEYSGAWTWIRLRPLGAHENPWAARAIQTIRDSPRVLVLGHP